MFYAFKIQHSNLFYLLNILSTTGKQFILSHAFLFDETILRLKDSSFKQILLQSPVHDVHSNLHPVQALSKNLARKAMGFGFSPKDTKELCTCEQTPVPGGP